jgi:hypothetical protein
MRLSCPTCGESAGSPDAGPCDGDHACANRWAANERDEIEHLAELQREVELARGNGTEAT